MAIECEICVLRVDSQEFMAQIERACCFIVITIAQYGYIKVYRTDSQQGFTAYK